MEEHGANSRRLCLVPPIRDLEDAAELLSKAADAVLKGQNDVARRFLRQADMPVLYDRSYKIMNQMPGELRRRLRADARPSHFVLGEGPKLRRPTASEEAVIYERDGYRCRYCGCRIVLKSARSVLTKLFPDVVPWPTNTDKGKHAAFYALNGAVDHVVPHSKGGDNSPGNLVATCWPCNNGKESFLLDEMGISDPRDRPPVVDDWDGLARLVGFHRSRAQPMVQPKVIPVGRTPKANALFLDQDEWLHQLELVSSGLPSRLVSFLAALGTTGASWRLNKVLLVTVASDELALDVFGVEASGAVQVPWMIADAKAQFKPFADAVARAIPGAVAYETARMWRVRGASGPLTLDELLTAEVAIRESLTSLHRSLQTR